MKRKPETAAPPKLQPLGRPAVRSSPPRRARMGFAEATKPPVILDGEQVALAALGDSPPDPRASQNAFDRLALRAPLRGRRSAFHAKCVLPTSKLPSATNHYQ